MQLQCRIMCIFDHVKGIEILFKFFSRFWNVFKAKQFISICQESIKDSYFNHFFEGWLCIISPYAAGLFAKSSTQKKAFTLCLFSLITTSFVPWNFTLYFRPRNQSQVIFWYLDDFPIGGWSPREETGWGMVNTDGWSHLPELSPGSVSPLSEPSSTVHQ